MKGIEVDECKFELSIFKVGGGSWDCGMVGCGLWGHADLGPTSILVHLDFSILGWSSVCTRLITIHMAERR